MANQNEVNNSQGLDEQQKEQLFGVYGKCPGDTIITGNTEAGKTKAATAVWSVFDQQLKFRNPSMVELGESVEIKKDI